MLPWRTKKASFVGTKLKINPKGENDGLKMLEKEEEEEWREEQRRFAPPPPSLAYLSSHPSENRRWNCP